MKCEAIKKIDDIENRTHRLLLTLRYVNNLSWEEIAGKMNYSSGHIVQRLHPKALTEFEKSFEKPESAEN